MHVLFLQLNFSNSVANWHKNLHAWDPSIQNVVKTTSRADRCDDIEIGTKFDVFLKDGSEKLIYTVTEMNRPHSITLVGENDMIHAVDSISFAAPADAAGSTDIHYTADINLKGWKSIFNFFIGGKLQTLATDTENGLKAALAANKHLE